MDHKIKQTISKTERLDCFSVLDERIEMKKCKDCKYIKRVSLFAYTCTKEKVFTKYVEPEEVCDYKKQSISNALIIKTSRNETQITMKELLLNIECELVRKEYNIYQTEEILQIVKKEINKI